MSSLTPEQYEELKADLLALQREIEAVVEGAREGARPVALDQQAVGRVSRMDALQQQAMAQANHAAMTARLKLIAGALQRLAEGEYGTCASCGEPVGYRRLKARPETPLCLSCQSERER